MSREKYFLSTNGINQILWEVQFSIFLLAEKFSAAVTQKLVQSDLNLNLLTLGKLWGVKFCKIPQRQALCTWKAALGHRGIKRE
jgi:hypothetical protein